MSIKSISFNDFRSTFINDKLLKHQPIHFEINNINEFTEFKKFCETHKIKLNNIVDIQLKELKELFELKYKVDSTQFQNKMIKEVRLDCNSSKFFLYLPWISDQIFNILPHKYHYDLITWRNLLKINQQEQNIIKTKKVGVIGSSVGSFASKIITKLGFEYIHIAEPKNMKPSNSTRMYADGLRHYGRHKLIPLAESIYEYNPFATVKLYKEGLNNQNVHDFFFDDKDRPLDIIIDAADDGLTKILIRKICKEYKIPMIAGFDEKGAIIIYRYDKPEILIEDDPSLNEETLKGIQERSQKDYIFKLLDFFPGGADNITSRQKKTIQGVLNKDLGGFSQLAWEASLFSAYISKATLDIALDKDITGAKLFDLDLEITDEMRVTSQKKAI